MQKLKQLDLYFIEFILIHQTPIPQNQHPPTSRCPHQLPITSNPRYCVYSHFFIHSAARLGLSLLSHPQHQNRTILGCQWALCSNWGGWRCFRVQKFEFNFWGHRERFQQVRGKNQKVRRYKSGFDGWTPCLTRQQPLLTSISWSGWRVAFAVMLLGSRANQMGNRIPRPNSQTITRTNMQARWSAPQKIESNCPGVWSWDFGLRSANGKGFSGWLDQCHIAQPEQLYATLIWQLI